MISGDSFLKRGSLFVYNASQDLNRTQIELNRYALHLRESKYANFEA